MSPSLRRAHEIMFIALKVHITGMCTTHYTHAASDAQYNGTRSVEPPLAAWVCHPGFRYPLLRLFSVVVLPSASPGKVAVFLGKALAQLLCSSSHSQMHSRTGTATHDNAGGRDKPRGHQPGPHVLRAAQVCRAAVPKSTYAVPIVLLPPRRPRTTARLSPVGGSAWPRRCNI
jgi:hypothetical protein